MFRELPIACSFTFVLISSCFSASPQPIATDCLIRVLDEASLASARDGLVHKINARRGDTVQESQVMVQIDDRESQAKLVVARESRAKAAEHATHHGRIEVAEAAIERAAKEMELLADVSRVPLLEKFRAKNDKEKATAERLAGSEEKRVNELEARVKVAEERVAEIDVEQRTILSPFDGIVTDELLHEAEFAEKGKPIIKILRMDKLLVQALLNTSEIAPHQASGLPAKLTIQLANQAPVIIEKLELDRVSAEIDLDGNYAVWTEVMNFRSKDAAGVDQWVLRPGMQGTLTIWNTETKNSRELAALEPSKMNAAHHD